MGEYKNKNFLDKNKVDKIEYTKEEEIIQEEIIEKVEIKTSNSNSLINKSPEIGTVIDVSRLYIIIEDSNGNGITKNGVFKDVKVGDLIEI